jgi:hypothetical protein
MSEVVDFRERWVEAIRAHFALIREVDINRKDDRRIRAGAYHAGLHAEAYELSKEPMTTPGAIREAGDLCWYALALARLFGVTVEALVVRLSVHPTTDTRLGPAAGNLSAAVQRFIRDNREPDSAHVADWLAIIIDHARDRAGTGLVRILAENEVKLRARLARGTIQGAGGGR